MSAPGPLVLVVEDEPQMRRFLRASLTSHGYSLCEASTAAEAVALATRRSPELMLLDLGLPDEDGVALTQRLREWSRVPIIVISARGREADKVEVLDAGADDYLTKPFDVGELLARMRVALRHAQQAAGTPSAIIEIGPLRIDLARREVKLDDANQIGTRKNTTLRNRPTVTVAAARRRKLRQGACGSSGFASGSHWPSTAASAHATTSSATALGAKAMVWRA